MILFLSLLMLTANALELKVLQRTSEAVVLQWSDLEPSHFETMTTEPPMLTRYLEPFRKRDGDLSSSALLTTAVQFLESKKQFEMAARIQRALAGEFGQFQKISVFESLLMEEHLKAKSEEFREFRALVLKKDRQILAYQVVGLQKSGGAPSLERSGVRPLVDDRMRTGWKVWMDLHNHPFQQQAERGNSGLLCPSEADSRTFEQAHRRDQTEEFRITNGVETLISLPDPGA